MLTLTGNKRNKWELLDSREAGRILEYVVTDVLTQKPDSLWVYCHSQYYKQLEWAMVPRHLTRFYSHMFLWGVSRCDGTSRLGVEGPPWCEKAASHTSQALMEWMEILSHWVDLEPTLFPIFEIKCKYQLSLSFAPTSLQTEVLILDFLFANCRSQGDCLSSWKHVSLKSIQTPLCIDMCTSYLCGDREMIARC